MAKKIGAVLSLTDKGYSSTMKKATEYNKKFRSSTHEAGNRLKLFKTQAKDAGNGIDGFAKKVTGVVAGMLSLRAAGNLFGSGMEAASSLEGYRGTLNILMKDQVKAAKTMKWAVDFANKTPFETDSIVQATVRLQSYGLEAQKVMPMVGDMAGVMKTDIMSAVEAVADAQTGELERLKSFGITKEMIVDHANKRMRMKNIINNKGQIVDQEKFNQALFSLMEDRFKGGMESQAKEYKGLWSTVTGVVKTSMARIMGITEEGEIVVGGVFDSVKNKVGQVADKLTQWSTDGTMDKIAANVQQGFTVVIETAGDAYEIIHTTYTWVKDNSELVKGAVMGLTYAWTVQKGVLVALTVAQNAHNISMTIEKGLLVTKKALLAGVIAAQVSNSIATGAATTAVSLFNAAMAANPVGVVIVALTALGFVLYKVYKHWDKITGAIKKAWGWLTKWKKADTGNDQVKLTGRSSGEQIGVDGSHASGLKYVPKDGYIAELHKGEAIIPAKQNPYAGRGRGLNITININGVGKSTNEIVSELVPQLKLALANM